MFIKNHIPSKIIALTFGLFATANMAIAASDSTTQSVTATVDEIAVLDVTAAPGTLTITAPATGGAVPVNAQDNATYAQYTSTVAAAVTRSITAKLGTGEAAPAGTSLKLTATPAAGEGTAAAQVTLNPTTAGTVVTGIGSVNTGTGATDGAQLTYDLVVDDVTALVASESKAVTVTLTLTEAS